MAKVLAVACDSKRLSDVNNLLRAHGHNVRGADCRSTMRHLLAQEPFQFIVVLDPLPVAFSDVLQKELHAGRMSPRLVLAEGMTSEDVAEMLAPQSRRPKAA